jgi:cell division protein FtsW
VYYTDVKQRPPIAEYDHTLLWLAVLLLGIGLVMVYSASIAIAEGSRSTGNQPMHYLLRQCVYVALGVALAVIAFQIPLRIWQPMAPFLFVFGLVLLALVLVPGIGREVNGSRRWLPLYFFNLQPSELMKLFVVLYAADYTGARRRSCTASAEAFCR